jgi:hypothetical protein
MVYSQTKSPIWKNLEGFGMEKVGIFYGHMENNMTVWYIL